MNRGETELHFTAEKPKIRPTTDESTDITADVVKALLRWQSHPVISS